MKYLKKDDTEEIVIKNEVDFNKNGTQVASTKEKVFAKIVESEKNNQYFIGISYDSRESLPPMITELFGIF